MLFTEPLFLFLFLPALLAVYFISPRRTRNPLLFGAGLLFYAWGQKEYVVVLLLSILLNYSIGRAIGRVEEMTRRRLVLSTGIGANLLILGALKYFAVLAPSLNHLLGVLHFGTLPVVNLHIPMGISFFTLLGISYIVDVYRQQISAERKLGSFSVYLTFFPCLIAGPLIRYADFAKDLVERRASLSDFSAGIRRFIIGMGKKMLIANALAVTVDSIFNVPAAQLHPGEAWLAVLIYPVQLYFDISGYADMAIGLALMFGFHLPENFNYPFVARSMTDFWQRWHITLVNWFRDYLFLPMSYRRSPWRIHLNLLVVFVLCGLWHEGSWKFIVWGVIHGGLLALERIGFARILVKWPRPFRHVYVILVVVSSGVFMRATSLSEALRFLGALFAIHPGGAMQRGMGAYANWPLVLALAFGTLGCVPLIPAIRQCLQGISERLGSKGASVLHTSFALFDLSVLATVFLASVSLSASGTYSPFIYFQF